METHHPQRHAHGAFLSPGGDRRAAGAGGVARGSGYRWAATTVAGVYSAFVLLMSWILPLFPAAAETGTGLSPA